MVRSPCKTEVAKFYAVKSLTGTEIYKQKQKHNKPFT